MGDPACFLSATCLDCGRFLDSVVVGERCPHCGGSVSGRREPPAVEPERVNIILYCAEWEACVEFYRGTLGLIEVFSNDWFCEFELGPGTSVSVANADRATIEAVGGQGVTISVEVSDLNAQLTRLVERGIAVGAIMKRFDSRVFDVFDPEGHRIEFWQG